MKYFEHFSKHLGLDNSSEGKINPAKDQSFDFLHFHEIFFPANSFISLKNLDARFRFDSQNCLEGRSQIAYT